MEREFGPLVEGWTPPAGPGPSAMDGRYVTLERLEASHGDELFDAYSGAPEVWDYMPVGPFDSRAAFDAWLSESAASFDPMFYAMRNKATGKAEAVASYLRIKPEAGSIEVGYIAMSPAIQRSSASTEAMVLMMAWAFEAGYRRYEWKCNALNIPSRRAAVRLGLSYEGVFRQAQVVKGRNRDTAWFAAIDSEWPALRAAFDRWLAPENFDAAGQQIARLSDLTAPVLVAPDPGLPSG